MLVSLDPEFPQPGQEFGLRFARDIVQVKISPFSPSEFLIRQFSPAAKARFAIVGLIIRVAGDVGRD